MSSSASKLQHLLARFKKAVFGPGRLLATHPLVLFGGDSALIPINPQLRLHPCLIARPRSVDLPRIGAGGKKERSATGDVSESSELSERFPRTAGGKLIGPWPTRSRSRLSGDKV